MKPSSNPSAIHRPQQPQNPGWHFYVITTLCCAVLVAGFFFAARQHFSSMEFSLQNSKLRQQVDELESEKRRLLVSREISMSPSELRKAVKRIGFVGVATIASDATKSATTEMKPSLITTIGATIPAKPANNVVKTVITAPVNKPPVIEKQARRVATISKKDRT